MSWRMRVRHTTTYEYSRPVQASYNEARISPLDTPNQFTLEHRVEVHPAANLFRYRDYWGSRVHAFDLPQPHTELKVVGSSVVETAERTPNLDDTVAWDAIDAPGFTDRFFEYLGDTRMTKSDDDIRQVARELRSASGPAAALSTLGEWLRAHVEYQTGTTSVSTTAVEVLRAGRGVCQDHAHLGIAVPRAAGSPRATRRASSIPTTSVGCSARCTRARATPGWRPGSAIGTRWTRRAVRPSPNGTSSSRAVVTTPMSRR